MSPPQAERVKECPGEVAGCGAGLEALDLNHANWQSMASQLSQNYGGSYPRGWFDLSVISADET